ncbi:MAG: helix-turn-helix transcriptional regulator [Gammaproteobacteria bacterium]
MQKQLADRIRMARRTAGLSQSRVAALLVVHRGTVGHWERGAGHRPTNANLMQLAVLTAVSYEWLATGRGSMQISSNEVPAVRLDCFAQTEAEEQLLLAYRKLPERNRPALVDFACSLVEQSFSQVTRVTTEAPAVVTSLYSTVSFLRPRATGNRG